MGKMNHQIRKMTVKTEYLIIHLMFFRKLLKKCTNIVDFWRK